MTTDNNDPLERTLSEFFRSEVPKPWPGAPSVASTEPNRATGSNTLFRSRLALAASVALVFGGGWLLTGQTRDTRPKNGISLEDTNASTKIIKDFNKESK